MQDITIISIKKWIKHRIDYYEDQAEKQVNRLTEESIEENGMLSAYYMVIEYIEGQRK